jgi:hypothetical protein
VITPAYCQLLARYGRWMNERLFAALATLMKQPGVDPGITDLPFLPGVVQMRD